MSNTFINIRVGRYFLQAWKWRVRVLRMDAEWMAQHGQPTIKVWQFFGYHG